MQPADRRVTSNLWISYPLYEDPVRGHSIYSAVYETKGRVQHSIVRSRPTSSGTLEPRYDVHRFVNSHDCFNPHRFAYWDGDYSRSVDGEAPYTVEAYATRADLDRFITLREVVSQMCYSLYVLHREGISHNGITLRKFLLCFRDKRLRVLLSDFSRSDRPISKRFRREAREDLRRLRLALEELLNKYCPNELDPETRPERCERRILDLFLSEFPSETNFGRPFHHLMAHPAISDYCRISQHLIQLSNTFQYPIIGPSHLRSVNMLGGAEFTDWISRLPFSIDAYEGDHVRARQSRLPANLPPNDLSNRDSAGYAIHIFRNMTEHWDRILRHFALVAQQNGSPPEAFARTWMRCLPQMFHVAWLVVIELDTVNDFPCLFRFQMT